MVELFLAIGLTWLLAEPEPDYEAVIHSYPVRWG